MLTNSSKIKSLLCLIGLLSLCCSSCTINSSSLSSLNDQINDQITVGWQTVWAPSGQIAQSLIHTNIAQNLNLDLHFTAFLFGPEINEAAITHNINCLNTGAVPAISLLSKSKDWLIIARLIRQPLAMVAAFDAGINSPKDLKGKIIAVPFGGGPHPYLLNLLEKNHLWDEHSEPLVHLENLSPSEQVTALQQKAVQAIATWEPQTSIATQKKLGKIIDQETSLGVIIIEKKFALAHPDLVTRLLEAYLLANFYTATHKNLTDSWFARESRFSKELINKITIVEPNLMQTDPHNIDLNITDADLKEAQTLADVMFKAGLIKEPVILKDRIDLSYLEKAQAEWRQTLPNLADIKIIQP